MAVSIFFVMGIYAIQDAAGIPRTAVSLLVNSSRAIRHGKFPVSSF